MIKAVIFDCFGVLTDDGWLPFKQKQFGHSPQLLQEATELNRRANARLISYAEFLDEIGRMAGMTAADTQRNINITSNAPNFELFDYIQTLKPKFKIGMLSNTSQNMLQKLFSRQQIDLFDAVVLSYEEGVTKPEEAAYQIIAGKLGVEPQECVFIDDQERHCVGAEAAGMQAIQYKDFDQMKSELEEILAASAGSNN